MSDDKQIEVGDRMAFEHWITDQGAWLDGITRNDVGDYVYMDTARSWQVWQAAMQCAASLAKGDAT